MVEVQWSAPLLLAGLRQAHLVLPGIRRVLLEIRLALPGTRQARLGIRLGYPEKSLHHTADKIHFHKNHNRRHFAGMVHMGRSYCYTNSYPLSSCIPSNVCKTPKQVLVNTQGFDFLLDLACEGINLCEIHCFNID
jgi:hypothetical protein